MLVASISPSCSAAKFRGEWLFQQDVSLEEAARAFIEDVGAFQFLAAMIGQCTNMIFESHHSRRLRSAFGRAMKR